MKSSGIDWIGDIPNEWDIKRIKYLAQLKGRIGWQGLTSDEYTDVGPFLITGVDFSNGGINWENCVHITEERWAEAPEIHIKNGDLLITKDGTVGKVAIVENLQEKASLNSGVLLIKTSNGYNKKFLYWALLSEEFWTWFRLKNAGNSTIVHLYQNDFAEFSYTFPNAEEQQAIADYLDQECAQIDSISADLEKQIELLQQYKKSLITETVTKGLDKTVPMKDSGVEWIGKIPDHWNAKRMKYFLSVSSGDAITNEQLEDGEYPVYGGGKQMGYFNRTNVDKNKILIGRVGANCGCVTITDVPSWATDNALVVQTYCHFKYIYYLLISADLNRLNEANAQPLITGAKVGNCVVSFTKNHAEQEEIARYLDEHCEKIENIIVGKQEQLETIRQHKKSLIYEYVTGKKRVKGVQ